MSQFVIKNVFPGDLNAVILIAMQDSGIDDPLEVVRRIKSGELVITEPEQRVFPIWKTAKLGTGLKTADDFRRVMEDAKMQVRDVAFRCLSHPDFTVASEEHEVDLVKASVKDLGFRRMTEFHRIVKRALSWGLEPCPAETGPQLRVNYVDQPHNERLVMAMAPIYGIQTYSSIFTLENRNGQLMMESASGAGGTRWGADNLFVFVKPRK